MADATLKHQNSVPLGILLAGNASALYFALFSDFDKAAPSELWPLTLPAVSGPALAAAMAVLIAALLDQKWKARLIFWRWKHPLPGSEAFTVHLHSDDRIDAPRLEQAVGGRFPTDPKEQNRIWYRLYLGAVNQPSVVQNHKEYLLFRDYATIAAFLVAAGLIALPFAKEALFGGAFIVFAVLQYLGAMVAARHTGKRFVCSVLAVAAGRAP